MPETNINSCCCGNSREEIELQEQSAPRVVLVDEDCCCPCDEIELHTDKEPDIILFEDYVEEYIDDIVATKETADAIKEKTDLLPEMKADTDLLPSIKEKTDLIPDVKTNTDLLPFVKEKTDLIGDVKDEVCGTSQQVSLRTLISEEADRIIENSSGSLEECTKQEIEQMFDGWMFDEESMSLPSMDIDGDGYVALDITVDNNGVAIFYND